MNLLKSKKSQGHIELILSFIIFVGFVVALLFILNPVGQKKINYNNLNEIQEKVLNNLSINYDYISLILEEAVPLENSCFSVDNRINKDSNFVILDEKGNNVQAKMLPNDKIYLKNNGGRYYKFYFSDEFLKSELNAITCLSLEEDKYTFGVLINEKIVFYDRLTAFNKSYIEDYSNFKKSLKIEDDFDFVIYDINKVEIFNESLSMNKVKATTVLSNEIALKTFDKNAMSKDIILRLRSW